ncbi:hypothetical protein BJF90_06275 [Pseudonocardia sp. CNS-004]|nr:hypothetical protein BJF90_06275 [Pseudonocardia sp. CNS-004]
MGAVVLARWRSVLRAALGVLRSRLVRAAEVIGLGAGAALLAVALSLGSPAHAADVPTESHAASRQFAEADDLLPEGRTVWLQTSATGTRFEFTAAENDTAGLVAAGLGLSFEELNATNGHRFSGPDEHIGGQTLFAPADWTGIWTAQRNDSYWRIYIDRFDDPAGYELAVSRDASPELIHRGDEQRIDEVEPTEPTAPIEPTPPGGETPIPGTESPGADPRAESPTPAPGGPESPSTDPAPTANDSDQPVVAAPAHGLIAGAFLGFVGPLLLTAAYVGVRLLPTRARRPVARSGLDVPIAERR